MDNLSKIESLELTINSEYIQSYKAIRCGNIVIISFVIFSKKLIPGNEVLITINGIKLAPQSFVVSGGQNKYNGENLYSPCCRATLQNNTIYLPSSEFHSDWATYGQVITYII